MKSSTRFSKQHVLLRNKVAFFVAVWKLEIAVLHGGSEAQTDVCVHPVSLRMVGCGIHFQLWSMAMGFTFKLNPLKRHSLHLEVQSIYTLVVKAAVRLARYSFRGCSNL